jgi:hypothetical protein
MSRAYCQGGHAVRIHAKMSHRFVWKQTPQYVRAFAAHCPCLFYVKQLSPLSIAALF